MLLGKKNNIKNMKKLLCFFLFDFGCMLERWGNIFNPIELKENIISRQQKERLDLILAWKKS